MKETKITLVGKEYPLIFSASAQEKIRDRFASTDGEIDTNNIGVKDVDALFEILMEAGRLYYKITEREYPDPLPCNPSDVLDAAEMGEAVRTIMAAIANSEEREVETVDEKNTVAAQEN